MNYFRKRKTRKLAKDILHHARNMKNMREDLISKADLERLDRAESELLEVMKGGDIEAIQNAANELYDLTCSLSPRKMLSGFRENYEVVVVALAVAMAIKAYFIQPFKIPTGSMQPTLYGVTTEEGSYKPNITDKPPFRYIKWIITGDSYKKVVVGAEGAFSGWFDAKWSVDNRDPVYMFCKVGDRKYKIPETAKNFVNPPSGEILPKGTVLWEGVMKAGDHVFVDKVSWNFKKPKRGDIIVFKTDNIEGISRGSHYIKRLVGMPGETIRVTPPSIRINGERLAGPRQITRIQDQADKYQNGYLNGGYYLGTPDSVYTIPDDGYMAFGDNTGSSQDSRYWGHVPRANMMGPAVYVYWPFSRRWGLANR